MPLAGNPKWKGARRLQFAVVVGTNHECQFPKVVDYVVCCEERSENSNGMCVSVSLTAGGQVVVFLHRAETVTQRYCCVIDLVSFSPNSKEIAITLCVLYDFSRGSITRSGHRHWSLNRSSSNSNFRRADHADGGVILERPLQRKSRMCPLLMLPPGPGCCIYKV